jgi:hypothetical protein
VRSVERAPGELTVTYRPEGSAGIGEVAVSASVPPFAGAGLGYVNDGDLSTFAEAISAYPLPDGAHPALTTGLDDQETLGLTVSQITSRGQAELPLRRIWTLVPEEE